MDYDARTNTLATSSLISWLLLSWSARFIVIENGNGAHYSTSGYFDIAQPAAGTVITGVGGAANVTVAANGVPLPSWTALYYIIPTGSSNTSQPGNFRVATYTAAFVKPDRTMHAIGG